MMRLTLTFLFKIKISPDRRDLPLIRALARTRAGESPLLFRILLPGYFTYKYRCRDPLHSCKKENSSLSALTS